MILNRIMSLLSRDGGHAALTQRRWEAARTNRLNQAHWRSVTGQTINRDLSEQLPRMRARCEHELANNSDFEGVVNTHICDVIGEDGPKLQVLSDDEGYNQAAERVWENWWDRPDVNGKLSGVDLLGLWWRSLWTAGEYLAQIVTAKESSGPVKMRLHNLHPRRLDTSPGLIGDTEVVLGVRRNRTGKPVMYSIDVAADDQVTADYEELSAADIIHEFIELEAGQARGVPWAVTGLSKMADLRDYDDQVMDAARQAADYGVVLHTKHPDAEYMAVNESVDIERRTISTAPPGWEPWQMTPQQPSTRYIEFHDEKLRALGRPVGMPLMMVKLDSRQHNFSSARFDGRVYHRGNAKRQKWLERRTLNRLVDLVLREAELAKALPAGPVGVRYQWNWPAPANVDPEKEAKGSTERLKNRTSNRRRECAERGLDVTEVDVQALRETANLIEQAIAQAEQLNADHADAAVDWRELAGFNPNGRKPQIKKEKEPA